MLEGVRLSDVLAGCSHSVNTTGNCLMRADIRISLPLKSFWLGWSQIMWIRLCASWGPEGKTGMTLLPVLGNNCCLDKEGQGCLLILTVSSEWACWLLQRILWKSHCSSVSGNIRTNLCNGLSCPVLPGGALAWDTPGALPVQGKPSPAWPGLTWVKNADMKSSISIHQIAV